MEFLDLHGSVLRPIWVCHCVKMHRRDGTGKPFGYWAYVLHGLEESMKVNHLDGMLTISPSRELT
jgi:hypothetical protein